MEPTFIELPAKKIVGMGTRFISVLSPDKDNATKIPVLWHNFVAREAEISGKITGTSYGLVEMLPAETRTHPSEMFYIAGVEVAAFATLPAGMLARTLPAGRYARFTHVGRLDRLGMTMKSIYSEWLPNAGVQLRPSPHLEVYDGRFAIGSDTSELDILLPLV